MHNDFTYTINAACDIDATSVNAIALAHTIPVNEVQRKRSHSKGIDVIFSLLVLRAFLLSSDSIPFDENILLIRMIQIDTSRII